MSENRVTTADLSSGCRQATASPNLVQWDRGQILKLTGVTLPLAYNVEFTTPSSAESVTMLGDADGVEIPDALLETGEPIVAYVVLHDTQNDRESEYWITIVVRTRQRPEDIDPDADQMALIDQLVAALDEGVDQAEAAAAQAEAAVEKYPRVINGNWYVWNEATETWIDTEVPATGPTGVGIASITQNADYTLTITFTDGNDWTTPTSVRGVQGETGATPNLSIGTVSTLAAGSPATASISGTPENPLLNLGIPKGADGDVSSASMASTFSSSTAYTKGTMVWYSGQLYEFTADHAAGAWTGSDARAVKVGEEVSSLKSALTQISTLGDNLFDKNSATDNYRLNAAGQTTQTSGYYTSDYIPVIGGETYIKNSPVIDQYHRICAYNISQSFIVDALTNNNEFTVPENAAYVRFCGLSAEKNTASLVSVSADDVYARKVVNQITSVKQIGNILSTAIDTITGKYYFRNVSNNLSTENASSYNGCIIKVVPNNAYVFSVNVKIVLLDEDKKPINQAGSGFDYNDIKTASSSSAVFMAISYKPSEVSGSLVISQGTELDSNTYSESYVPITVADDSFSDASSNPIENQVITKRLEKISSQKIPYEAVSDAIASGEKLLCNVRSGIIDGKTVVFKAFISAFESLRLAFIGYSEAVMNYVEVNATEVLVKNDASARTAYPHGITSITNDLAIIVKFVEGNADITVCSNGESYHNNVEWHQNGAVAPAALAISTNTVCTSASLTIAHDGINRKIWYFGDSYMQFNNDERISKYLTDFDVSKNVYISAVSGASSAVTETAFNTLLIYGTPTFAVFGTGMNDGSDTDASTPAATWVTNRDKFLAKCTSNNITPVFCTIPTVPTVNNEAKNNWVKNSGYRYIDYAKAVGASSSGVWYSGMLSSDNVHPTANGAKALFTQLLCDLPEITINH